MRYLVGLTFASLAFLFPSPPSAQLQCGKPRDFTSEDRIVGGRRALIENWPGQAVLRVTLSNGPAYVCGGSLIAPDVVLTAAHCVIGWSEGKTGWKDIRGNLAEVVLGVDDLSGVDLREVHQIASVIVHEDYVSAARGNDVALIRLRRRSSEPSSRLSLSPQSDPTPQSVTPLMVAGFGLQAEGVGLTSFKAVDNSIFFAGARHLLEATVPLANAESCHSAYGSRFGEKQICAGFVEGGKDSCQGDSGGPLVAFDRAGCPYQVGLVSWGAGCARANAYGIYTRLSSFAPWIGRHVAGVRSIALEEVNVPTSRKNELVESTFNQLRDELSGSTAQSSLAILSGTKLRIGDTAIFRITGKIAGRPLIIDINAKGEVSQIFPNNFSGIATIASGQTLTIPDSAVYRFPVQEPYGRGKLVAMIVPDHFNMEALEKAKQTRGFTVQAGLSYMQNLIQLIRIARGSTSKGFGVEPTGAVPTGHLPRKATDWGLAELDYEVIP